MKYQPKGGMCMTCINAMRDCSNLKFDKMKPLKKDCDIIIVRCEDYNKQ